MSETPAPFVTRDTRIRTSVGTILSIVIAAVLAATGWAVMKSDVEAHARQLDAHDARLRAVERKLEADHDLLLEIRGDLKALRARTQ